MVKAFVLLAVALALMGIYSRDLDRSDRRDRRISRMALPAEATATADPDPTFLFLSETDSVAGECTCIASPLTADTGQNVTFTRTGSAWCTKSDYTVVKCTNSNTARMTRLLDPDGEDGTFALYVERGSTNDVVYSNDLTQAGSWASVTTSFAKDATGPDGVANSASSATATAPGAVFWQTVTASGNRSTSFYIRRKTGTGVIQATREGGAGWHAITSDISSTWKRFQPQPCGDFANCVEASWLNSTFTNPVIGFEIQSNGDAIELAFVQDEALAWASSVIETGSGAVARNQEGAYWANPTGTYTTASMVARVAPFVLGSQNVHTVALRSAGQFMEARTVNGDGTVSAASYFGAGTMAGTSPVVWDSNVPSTFGNYGFSWDGSAGRVCDETSCNATTGATTLPASPTAFNIGRQEFLGNASTQGLIGKVCLDPDPDKCLTWMGISL